jgi:DNA polymerase
MTGDDDPGRQILEHLKFYQDLGVRWVRASEKPKQKTTVRAQRKPEPALPPVSKQAPKRVERPGVVTNPATSSAVIVQNEALNAIRAELQDCRSCKLCSSRKNLVFGSGDPHAELMFVGEAPGADEDEQGLPFVGRAGQLLTKIIESVGLSRSEVFICNILKCRPPNNRNPEADEIAACEQFLFRQVEAVKPKILCALGTFGAQTLLRTTEPIGRLRGRLLDYRGVKLLATYHPAYLLRNPMEKRKVWEDMLVIRKYLDSIHLSK